MADTGASFSIDASPTGGARRIYGYPGGGIDSITTTLCKEVGTWEGEAGSHNAV